MITIVDYGMGNLGSIANMLRKIGVASRICRGPDQISDAEKLILPGVGAFDAAMMRINEGGLREVLDRKALVERVPVLGICLGMQLLTRGSEEGCIPGLGWIPAETFAFRNRVDSRLKVPHMGWNIVEVKDESLLTRDFGAMVEPRFYFVHSYFVRCDDAAHCVLQTTYGVTFDSGVQSGNVFGVQFHPEKSHRFGMKLLANFASL